MRRPAPRSGAAVDLGCQALAQQIVVVIDRRHDDVDLGRVVGGALRARRSRDLLEPFHEVPPEGVQVLFRVRVEPALEVGHDQDPPDDDLHGGPGLGGGRAVQPRGTLVVYESVAAGQSRGTVAGFRVDDLESVVAALRDRGVAFEEYDLPDLKTENGIASIGDLRASWARDPDGNIIAFEQRT